MIWKRSVLVAALAITGLALETSLFGSMTLLGTKPELLLLIVVALAIGEGPLVGAVAGFTMGLLTDLVLHLPQGVTALTFTIVGYAVGAIRAQLQAPSAWLPMIMVFFATLFGSLFYGGFTFLLGQESLTFGRVMRHATLASVYNALLTPFVYPLIRGIAARMRPRGVSVR